MVRLSTLSLSLSLSVNRRGGGQCVSREEGLNVGHACVLVGQLSNSACNVAIRHQKYSAILCMCVWVGKWATGEREAGLSIPPGTLLSQGFVQGGGSSLLQTWL
jgi:hypothetical protein